MTARLATLAAAALALVAVEAAPALACKCALPTLPTSYQNQDATLAVRVHATWLKGDQRLYRARVMRTFKGCTKAGSWVLLTTSASPAACGVTLKVGGAYLVTGSAAEAPSKLPAFAILLCSFTAPLQALTPAERKFLLTREVCCGDACACANGAPPVQCLVDPCAVSTCPVGTCEASYCGGCNATWTDDQGQAVCQPCKTSFDCGAGQACLEGRCLPEPVAGGCAVDGDCPKGEWCRPTQDPAVSECVPFVAEGGTCGGFVPPWLWTQCAPGLVCTDVPPLIPDLPGTCRKPCSATSDCGKDQYCGATGYCRDMGTCFKTPECDQPDNIWIKPLCVGYSECSAGGQCGWICGPPPAPQ